LKRDGSLYEPIRKSISIRKSPKSCFYVPSLLPYVHFYTKVYGFEKKILEQNQNMKLLRQKILTALLVILSTHSRVMTGGFPSKTIDGNLKDGAGKSCKDSYQRNSSSPSHRNRPVTKKG
jgi:hypothetical protein